MKTNVVASRAVQEAVWSVGRAMDGTVPEAVYWAMYDTVFWAVNQAVNRPVYGVMCWVGFGTVSRDPSHPALADFLSGAAAKAS